MTATAAPVATHTPAQFGRERALLDLAEHAEALLLGAEGALPHAQGDDADYLRARCAALRSVAKRLRTSL